MVRFALISIATALYGTATVAAKFAITAPGSTVWWVAKSQNTLTWTCNDSPPAQQYTVLVGNKDQNVLTAPIAVVGILNNYDCSHTITQDQANQAPGLGYKVLFANIVNQSDILAESEEFEIKPLGSLYPSQVTPSASSGSANSTGSSAPGASATKKPGNGAPSSMSTVGGLGLGLALMGAIIGMATA